MTKQTSSQADASIGQRGVSPRTLMPLPLAPTDLQRLIELRHDTPHNVLGPHYSADRRVVTIRAFMPTAARLFIRPLQPPADALPMQRLDPAGVFVGVVADPGPDFAYELLVVDENGQRRTIRDAFAFAQLAFDAADAEKFRRGCHTRLYEKLGAHPSQMQHTAGVRFAVWAPAAERVSVVGTFNGWDGRCHPMRRFHASGVWEIFVPGAAAGDLYKFEIRSPGGSVFLKSDPFAACGESPPHNASIIHDFAAGFAWRDASWVRPDRTPAAGFALYALDLDADVLMQAIAEGTLARVAAEGYTHVELIAPSRHLWGGASLFAPGPMTPAALMQFINRSHAAGLGVIMPGARVHLPARLADLTWFDGTQVYERAAPAPAENEAPMQGVAPDNLAPDSFALDKGEVRSVLLSQATFAAARYHADGWRTDPTVATLLAELQTLEPDLAAERWVVTRSPATRAVVAPRADASGSDRPDADVERLLQGRHRDPGAILGVHATDGVGTAIWRTFQPRAEQVFLRRAADPGRIREMIDVNGVGLFEATDIADDLTTPYCWLVKEPSASSHVVLDAYAFDDAYVTPFDQHLFNSGNHYRIYDKLGAHCRTVSGIAGVTFAVWAPNAEGVSIVGPLNRWDGRYHQMRRLGASGVWELFVPELAEGEFYKFEIRARNGHTYVKADPYAFFTEVPPANASIVYEPQRRYAWGDQAWMERRARSRSWEEPVSIYEVHLGSWRRDPATGKASYRDLSERLIPYVKDMGFTHIELMPIAEHPFEPSWGYQVTNYYAPSARYGRPEDLMAFVDACHQHGIGVIFDWVPAHFPKDAFALAWFDGTHLYEHADPRQGEHRDWGTLIFNYGRHEVENFLIANAMFWLEHYHFDGLRVDAVASMLYLDYSRPADEWIPNKFGGRENLEAIEFLKHTNAVVHGHFPGVMMIAEESTAWPKVSRPTDEGGLGFGFKWNMGWMHDTLAYMSTPPEARTYQHHRLTFSLVYAFNEHFILSLSHDEVVHLKGSLLTKMPGEDWERLANLRLLYAYMWAHPGKKLLFMGGEFGQASEWSEAGELDWGRLRKMGHRQLKDYVAALNHLYRRERALFEVDGRGAGFEWLEVDNGAESILAFVRKANDPRNALVVVFNFSAISWLDHRLGVPYPVTYDVIFDSNEARFGGFTAARDRPQLAAEGIGAQGQAFSLRLSLPALSAIVLKPAAANIASTNEFV